MKLTAEQFQRMLAGLGAQGIERERRDCARVPLGARATIISTTNGRHEPINVIVMNVSETGIALMHSTPLRNGETFILSVAGAAGYTPSAILCSVMHSQKIGNGMFAIGAHFARMLAVKNEQPAATPFVQPTADLGQSDLDHVREVEGRLRQITLS